MTNVTIVQSDVTIVVPWQLSTESIYDCFHVCAVNPYYSIVNLDKITLDVMVGISITFALGVVAKWSMVLIPVPWPLMV